VVVLIDELLYRLYVWRVMLVADGEMQAFYGKFGFQPYPDVMA
jgi:hypothetical protein